MNSKVFRMNFILPIVWFLFLIFLIPIDNFNFSHCFFLLIGIILFVGSLLLLWQIEINHNGIIITYLIPLGRNRKLDWDDIYDMSIYSQTYRLEKFIELMIIPKNEKKITFFKYGVLNYNALCEFAIQIYKEKKKDIHDK